MKKLMIAAAALMVSIAAYGQGQFVFNNRIPPDINAKFQLSSDTGTTSSLAGSAYTVQLLGGKPGTPTAQLTQLATTDFRTGAAAGYVNPITVTVPGVTGVGADTKALVLLRVFSGTGTTGAGLTDFGPYTVDVAAAPATPPNMALGTSALIVNNVPEPTTLALGALGLGALLAIRRRK
jgi:MYXO-CTERM domain-containing protein